MLGKLLSLLGLNSIQLYILIALLGVAGTGYGMLVYYKHEATSNAALAKQAQTEAASNKAAYDGAMDSIIQYAQIKAKVDASYEKARSEENKQISALDRKNISADLEAKPDATIAAINHGIASLFSSINCSSNNSCSAQNTHSTP